MSISKYPLDKGDQEGITDAVNYLLSGPSGLGQNFQGFSAYLPAYIRPSSRQPWSLPVDTTLDPSIYLSLFVTDIQPVGGNPSNSIIVTFSVAFATPPFQFGDRLDLIGINETGGDTSYNGGGNTVFECTTTTVTFTYQYTYNWPTYNGGGTVGRNFINYENDTDCNARVTVSGATTQVFVSAQLNLEWVVNCLATNDYSVTTKILRLAGQPSVTPGSSEYNFTDTVVVSEKTFDFHAVYSGELSTDRLESIFTTVLDGPNLAFGYYWYILAVYFNIPGGADGFSITGTKLDSVNTTFINIGIDTVTGSGSGAQVKVTLYTSDPGQAYISGVNTDITVTNPGVNYKVGDILSIPGTSLGSASPDNDMTLTVTSIGIQDGPAAYDVEIGRATMGLRSLTAQVIKQ